MKSYYMKLKGREEGPFSESQIAQMFADGRADRSTACRASDQIQWRTIDEHLPTLKYGTERPDPARASAIQMKPVPGNGVKITDIDIPFYSLLKLGFKAFGAWLIVVVCYMPVMIIAWLILIALIAALVGGAVIGLPHK